MSAKGSRRKADVLKARIRQMVEAGKSVSAIAKELGISYVHAARVAGWLADEGVGKAG